LRQQADKLRLPLVSYLTAVSVVACALSYVAIQGSTPPVNGGFVVALVVLVGSIYASLFPVYVEFKGGAQTFTLTELPVLVAALTLSPAHGFAVVIAGATIARIFVQKTPPMKAIFNGAVLAIEMALVVLCLRSISPAMDILQARTWAAAIVGALVGNIGTAALVLGVIRINGKQMKLHESIRSTALGMTGALVISGVAISVLVLAMVNPISLIFSTMLVVGVIMFHHRHVVMTERYRALLRLERFTRALAPSGESIDGLIDELLSNAAALMNTESSAIVLASRDGNVFLSKSFSDNADQSEIPNPVPTDWVWVRATGGTQAFALTLQNAEPGVASYLHSLGVRDLIVAPLQIDDNTVGLILGHNRRVAGIKLSAADLDLVGTMAHHASVNLKCSRLIEQLETEVVDRQYEATHDSLTGMFNRAAFNTTTDAHFEAAGKTGLSALMLVDLNQFKKVNDTMGHHAGDAVLVQISSRLQAALPVGSTVARLGGDEYAVLVPGVADAAAALVAAACLRDAIRMPVTADDVTFALDASIGVSISPQHGTDRHTLLKRADIAMYAAKERRATPIALYDPSQQRWTSRELGLLEDLRQAIDLKQLTLAYQPKTSLADGRVIGVEALCRWNHAEHGPVRPDEFIALAEQAGLIDSITDFVLHTALAQTREWLDQGFSIGMAINLPARSLSDPTLAGRIATMAAVANVPPAMLTLEVTESELVQDAKTSRDVMATLRSCGFHVSIDDFGTGYSSLAYLHTLPVDELKIDRAFVQNVATDETSRQIVHVIVELAKTFGLKTVAEGIETQEVHDCLLELGVELGQGYLMARPAPAHELTEVLRVGYRHAPHAPSRLQATEAIAIATSATTTTSVTKPSTTTNLVTASELAAMEFAASN
jgi:diguanylate cyclase (GGDEF)-like protein